MQIFVQNIWYFAWKFVLLSQKSFYPMKPKRIILIRHGESQANVDRYLFGQVPDYTIELTDKGHEQAKEAGSYSRPIKL